MVNKNNKQRLKFYQIFRSDFPWIDLINDQKRMQKKPLSNFVSMIDDYAMVTQADYHIHKGPPFEG